MTGEILYQNKPRVNYNTAKYQHYQRTEEEEINCFVNKPQ